MKVKYKEDKNGILTDLGLIIKKGRIIINSVIRVFESESAIGIEIDCKSKYVETCYSSSGCIELCTGERTLYLDNDSDRMVTSLQLKDYSEGWEVFCIDSSRYTVRAVLIKSKEL
jgi:hypothetical protein